MGENDLIFRRINSIIRRRNTRLLYDIGCFPGRRNRKICKGYLPVRIGCAYLKLGLILSIQRKLRPLQRRVILIHLDKIDPGLFVSDLQRISVEELICIEISGILLHQFKLIPYIILNISTRSLDLFKIIYMRIIRRRKLELHILLRDRGMPHGCGKYHVFPGHMTTGCPLPFHRRCLIRIVHHECGIAETLRQIPVLILEDMDLLNISGSAGVRLGFC